MSSRNCVLLTTVDLGKQVTELTHASRLAIRSNRPWLSRQASNVPEAQSTMPFALLGQEGWEAMDPFVPVEVTPYTEAEVDVLIDYLRDKR